MKKELVDFYYDIALDIARAEQGLIREAEASPDAGLTDDCLTLTRARAVALGSRPTQPESGHLSGCRLCARLVHNFGHSSPAERTPAVRRLLEAVNRYAQASGEVTRGWLEAAQHNAAVFSHGVGELAFDDEPAIARSFEADGLSIRLDLREQTDQFVVEVSSANEALCGGALTVMLLGGTGHEEAVTLRLSGRRPGVCYGSAAAGGRASEVINRLGPLILPVVVPAAAQR